MRRRKGRDPRLVIAIPLASPFIYWRTVAGILEMERPSLSDLMVFQGALVDRARNHLVCRMLDHPIDPTHLLFLDADIVPPRETVGRLLRANKSIVSGLYRKRLPPYEPMAFLKGRGGALKPISPKGPRLRRVDFVGAGCLLITREVFETIKPPWFTSEWTERGHLAEDFSFCEKARRTGFSIYVDTTVRPLHLEPVGIGTGRDGGVSFISLEV